MEMFFGISNNLPESNVPIWTERENRDISPFKQL